MTSSAVGEVMSERGGPGSVVLDMGGDVGAAVVRGPARLEGSEIEIRADKASWDGSHAAFRQWETAAGRVVAAVFPQLAEGWWAARVRDRSGPVIDFQVTGGRVTTVTYPS